jgi:hypothetical protein
MIDLKEAIEKAKQFIIDLNGEQEKLQLEAAYLSRASNSWNVTYSFWRKEESPNQLQQILGINSRKIYKTIEIDAESGEVIGIQMGLPEKKTETV